MRHYLQEVIKTLSLAVPMIVGMLGQMTMFAIDAAMIGRVGVVPLAASTFGGNVISIFMIAGFGLGTGIHILVGRSHSQRQPELSQKILFHGMTVALVYSVLMALTITWGRDLLGLLGQTDEVLAEAKPYAVYLAWSIVPTLLYHNIRSYIEAQSRPWIPVCILAIGLSVNIGLNWLLIYGNLGFPAMGLEGAGLATLLARLWMLVTIFIVVRLMRDIPFLWHRFRIRFLGLADFKEYLGLGIPTAIQIVFEHGAFVFVAIMMGWISEETLAAHGIAIRCCAYSFMIPLGLSFATSIRISQALGRKDDRSIGQIGYSSLGFSAVFMLVCALIFFLFREQLPWLFMGKAAVRTIEVARIASILLVLAAFFQLFDGFQIVALGCLRGLKDVKMPAIISFAVYWLLCIPLGMYLAFEKQLGGPGLWMGLLAGLFVAAAVLIYRFRHNLKRIAE